MVQHMRFACFSCQSTLRSVWETADLRFANPENEVAFYEGLQSQSLLLAALAGLSFAAFQLVIIAILLVDEETLREDVLSGVYSIHFLLLPAIAAASIGIVSVGSLVKEITRRSCVLLEPLWAFAIAINIIVGFFQSRAGRSLLGGRTLSGTLSGCMDDRIDLEISAVLLTALVSICCHCHLPRCCYLWLLVGLAMVSFVIQAFGTVCEFSKAQGLAPRLLNIGMMFFLLTTSYSAAHRLEKKHREGWLRTSPQEQIVREALARKELGKIALARDLKIFRLYGCCLVFGLFQDFRISRGASRTARTLFGAAVTGKSFLSFVAEENREEFSAFCQRSDGSRIPKSIGLKLIVQDALEPAHVLVIHHGRHRSKEFLMGIRLNTGLEDLRLKMPEKEKSNFQHPIVPVASTDYIEPFELEHPDKRLPMMQDDEPATIKSARSSDYSGFSSGGSSASLCFSESQDGSSGFSQVLSRRDQRTQTDAFLCQTDQCVETVVPWKDVGFRCKCSNRAPKPLSEERRAAIACRDFRPRRQKRKVSSSLEAMSGTWALESQFIGIAQSFMHRLTFVGNRCIDARGQKWKVTQEGNDFFLIKGRIWTSGGVLFREGKSGIVMRFQPEEEEEEADPFEFAEDPDLNFEEDEQDGLKVLENILSDGYFTSLTTDH